MKNHFNKYHLAFIFMCSNFMLFADPGAANDTSDLENVDAPAAPINDYLWILALVGIIFIFMKLKAIQTRKIPMQ